MADSVLISVIVPTYNRKESLRQVLHALERQSLSPDRFEVIVVDDGSTETVVDIAGESYPCNVRYLRQDNQGDAAARNLGARNSLAEILVFIDDDILVEPGYLDGMSRAVLEAEKCIVMGITHLWTEAVEAGSHRARSQRQGPVEGEPPPFVDLCSNNMSVRREDYLAIGMMEGLGFPGSDIWCDVDFAYRAHLQGYTFTRAPLAVAYHKDYVMENMDSLSQRMEKVGYRAAALFRKYPGLLPYLDMFRDKTPIHWGKDSPNLVSRKLLRWSASIRPALWALKGLLYLVGRSGLFPQLAHPLRRWISGGYLYRGYRRGLRDFGMLSSPASVELGAVQKAV